MAREQDDGAFSHRLLSLGAVGLLAAAGALAFSRVFRGHVPALKLVAAALLSVAVAGLCERRGAFVAVLASGAGLLVVASTLVFPDTVFGIFPTPDTFRALGRALHHVNEQARVQVAPTPALRPLLLAALTAVWTASFAAHALAIRAGSPLMAALPPASLLAFADILLEDGARPGYAALFLASALAVLFMDGLRRVRQWGPLRPWSGWSKHRMTSPTATRGARRLTAVALGAALLIPGVLPGFQARALLDIDTTTVLSSPTISPLVSVTASLKRHTPIDLYLIQSNRPAYWRWLALDTFDGDSWTTSDLEVEHGDLVPSDDPLPPSPLENPGPDVRQIEVDQTGVVLQDTSNPWLPMAYRPSVVAVEQSSIKFDPETASAVPEVGVSRGLPFTVRSEVVVPTRSQLDQITDSDFASPTLRPYQALPNDTPAEIYAIARQISQGETTPFGRILAIQNYLRTFDYDQSVSGAHDVQSVLNFLTHTHKGFCQQFATAMAVLVRALGYPARIAVGFTPGTYDTEAREWRVSTENAHSWVEVLFPGIGWLAFEPTPTRDNPIADAYLNPEIQVPICRLQGTCGPGSGTTSTAGGGTGDRNRVQAREALLEAALGRAVGAPGAAPLESGRPYRLPLLLLGIALALALAVFLIGVPISKTIARRLRVRRAHRPEEIVLAAYRSFAGNASDIGLRRGDGETLREYRDRLRRAVRFSDGHLDRLTAMAGRAAYSQDTLSRQDAKEAVAAARRAMRDVRRSAPLPRRVLGLFRPGL